MIFNVKPEVQSMDAMNNNAPALLQKISRIRAGINKIAKAGTNQQQKYRFVRGEDVFELMRPLFVECGVELEFSCRGLTYREVAKGTHVVGDYSIRLSDIDTGATRTYEFIAEAADYSDKAANKCHTAALKYWLLRNFLMSAGDDVDADQDSPNVVSLEKKLAESLDVGQTIREIVQDASSWDEVRAGLGSKLGHIPTAQKATVAQQAKRLWSTKEATHATT